MKLFTQSAWRRAMTLAFLLLGVLPVVRSEVRIDLAEGSEYRVPFFEAESGERWASLIFRSFRMEKRSLGPFELGTEGRPQLIDPVLRLEHMPASPDDWRAVLKPFKDSAGRPDGVIALPHLKIELRGTWLLVAKDFRMSFSEQAHSAEQRAIKMDCGSATFYTPTSVRRYKNAAITLRRTEPHILFTERHQPTTHIESEESTPRS